MARVHWIQGPGPGRLGIAGAPPPGDKLAPWIRAAAQGGVRWMASCLTGREAGFLGLVNEPWACLAAGIEHRSLAIPDRQAPGPGDEEEARALCRELAAALRRGDGVVVHCRAGRGRSACIAALAACLAWEWEPEEAFAAIEEARGVRAPEMEEQRAFVREALARWAPTGPGASTQRQEPAPMNKPPRAFTLIELLIVVAIIAVLAAIAVPNFLEAQVRAKVARAKADLRAVGTALEAYRVDQNAYPTMLSPGFTGGIAPLAGSNLKWWYVPDALTTPVAYLSTANLLCPFGGNVDRREDFPDLWRRYSYENIPELMAARTAFPILANRYRDEALRWSGQWRLNSVGPDQVWNPSTQYDPSNGTVSAGDIIRTQLNPAGNTNPDNLGG